MYTCRCQTSTPSIRIPSVPWGDNFSTEATGLLTTPLTLPIFFPDLYDPTRV